MDVQTILFVYLLCEITFGNSVIVSQSPPPTQYDTMVIGLGASGIAAASTLARAGQLVLGLEAQDRIGGRVWTFPFGDGIVERGAEWIHGERPSRVYKFAIKNNITLKKQTVFNAVLSSDGKQVDQELVNAVMAQCIDFSGESLNVPETLGNHMTKKLMDYLKHKPEVLNDTDFIEELLGLLNLIVCGYEGTTDWNNITTNSRFQELEGFQHWSWHRNGYKTLFDVLLNKYQDGPGLSKLFIKLNTEVSNIYWPEKADTRVTVWSKTGEVFTANNVIVAVSLGVLKERHQELFSRPIPEEKVQAIERIPMGLLDKIIFSFSNPWWTPEQSTYFFLWKKNDIKAVPMEDRWTSKIMGTSCPMGSSNTLTLWISGDNAKVMETLPEDVVKTKALAILQKFMGGNLTIPEPIKMIRTTWFTNPYTRGSYSYDDMVVAQFPQSRSVLGKPLLDSSGEPRVLFAGEASDETHFSTVHGAVDSGFREALRLLARKSKKLLLSKQN